MFSGTNIGIEAYSALLIQLQATAQATGVVLDGGNAVYNAAAFDAWEYLTNELDWTIVDGGWAGF